MPAVREALWDGVSHVLDINVFTVNAFEARIVVATFALLVIIISNTYLANLAAFLTTDRCVCIFAMQRPW